jgi:hypothetical protein
MPRTPLVMALLLGSALPLRPASAVVCSELPNTLWLQIGDTQEPLIKFLGKALRHSTANPMTIVYITSGSCTNIDAIYKKTPITVTAKYIPDDSQVPNWDPSTAAPTCTNTPTGHAIDVANSALFVSTCNPAAPPADVQLYPGPVQAYTMVVPRASSQRAITAEEAYFVFGYGNQDDLTPWNDETQMYGRTVTKSTLLTWANTIRVLPATKWKGRKLDASDDVRTGVINSPTPEKAIGILGAEVYDANRTALKVLAFQWFGQNHAFFPDSTDQAFDKRNVRDGHYAVWSPTVWMTHVDPDTKVPLDIRTQYLINLILGKAQTPAFDSNSLDIVVARGLVPDCAMQVTRSVEAGELSLYQPAEPCGCYYDSQVGSTSCAQCTSDSSCAGGGKCRYGYCEAR